MKSKIKYTNNPLHKNNNNLNFNNNNNNHLSESNYNNYIVNDFYEEMTEPVETNKEWCLCNFLHLCTFKMLR